MELTVEETKEFFAIAKRIVDDLSGEEYAKLAALIHEATIYDCTAGVEYVLDRNRELKVSMI